MKTKFNWLSNEQCPEFDESFQELWQFQKKGGNENEVFSDDHIDQSFMYQTTLDWTTLRKIAHKETEFEKLWRVVGTTSYKRIALWGIAGIIITPLLLIIAYQWGIRKIEAGTSLQDVIGWAVIFATAGISAMVIGAPLYLLSKRLPKPTLLPPVLAKFEMLFCLTISSCIVILAIFIYQASSRPIAGINTPAGYKNININGTSKLVSIKYYKLMKTNSSKLLHDFSNDLSANKTQYEDPEFLNAVALKLEDSGKIFQSEVAYALAAKNDPFGQVVSYQKNQKADLEKNSRHAQLYYVSRSNRYVDSKYWVYFSSPDQARKLIDSATRLGKQLVSNPSLINSKAVAYEYLRLKDSAVITYKCALNHSKKDPVLLINTRKFLDERPLDSVLISTKVSCMY